MKCYCAPLPVERTIWPQNGKGRSVGPWALAMYEREQWGERFMYVMGWSRTEESANKAKNSIMYFSHTARQPNRLVRVQRAPFHVDNVTQPWRVPHAIR